MAKNKKTIVFFNGVYLPHLGGVERYTFELATRLSNDYNVVIVTSNTNDVESVSEENGVKVFRLPVRGFLKNRLPKLKKNAEYNKLVDEIKSLEIDHVIINTRFYDTTFLGLQIAKEKRVKPLIIDHSGGFVLKAYEKLLLPRVKKYRPVFYSVSETNQAFLKREFKIESKGIFYNAIDSVEDFKKQKNEKVKILFAGRVMKEKGIIDLLEAYRKIKNHVNAELIVAGDGPLLKTVKEKYRAVKFLGHVNHEKLVELFREADVFVFPTHYHEGFPTVLLEAGANKCATIIYNDGAGAMELIGSEEYGIIVKRKNIDDLKMKLEMIISDEKMRKEKQEKFFERVNKCFTWDNTIKCIKKELEK